jgi:hypothetical protein
LKQLSGLGDREVISGLVAILTASYAAFFAWVVASINRLDRKIDSLDAKSSAKIDSLDTKFSARLDAKIDSFNAKLSAEIKSLDSRLTSSIDALSTRIDSLTTTAARLEGRGVGSHTSRADPRARFLAAPLSVIKKPIGLLKDLIDFSYRNRS